MGNLGRDLFISGSFFGCDGGLLCIYRLWLSEKTHVGSRERLLSN